VAVDGKTARGARQPDGSRTHLFSMVDHDTGTPLGQVLAPTKGTEIAAFSAFGPDRPHRRRRHRRRLMPTSA